MPDSQGHVCVCGSQQGGGKWGCFVPTRLRFLWARSLFSSLWPPVFPRLLGSHQGFFQTPTFSPHTPQPPSVAPSPYTTVGTAREFLYVIKSPFLVIEIVTETLNKQDQSRGAGKELMGRVLIPCAVGKHPRLPGKLWGCLPLPSNVLFSPT